MPVGSDQEKEVAVQETAPQKETQTTRGSTHWIVGIAAFALVAGALTFGILPRVTARTALRKETAQMALTTVAVIHPERAAQAEEVVLPANVQAFISRSNLCPNERVSEEVVRGRRSPRDARTTFSRKLRLPRSTSNSSKPGRI